MKMKQVGLGLDLVPSSSVPTTKEPSSTSYWEDKTTAVAKQQILELEQMVNPQRREVGYREVS